jgi:tetratricopeptide (TPR) repeat protein
MGLFSFFRPLKTPEFLPGAIFYTHEDGEFQLYKIIRFGEEGLFVKAWWPNTVQPKADNLQNFELRNACEPFHVSGLEHATVLANEGVSEEDENGYQEFLRIQEGIDRRASEMVSIMEKADALMNAGDFEAAAHLYTEAASFSKYFFSLFDKRGYCYLKLNRFSEAIADLEHSLSIYADGLKTLYDCGTAHYHSGNHARAIECLEQLVKLDPEYEGAKELLEKAKGL